MSWRVLFDLSSGLSRPMVAPAGTLERIRAHVAGVERALGLRAERYLENPPHWTRESLRFEGVDDRVLCETARDHNAWVVRLYEDFARWHKEPAPEPNETITPEDSTTFWHGLVELRVPPSRWTGDHYVAEMRAMYEVLRGRPEGRVDLDERPLTPRQAGAVIRLFEQYFESGANRDLEVPRGHDHLADRYHGEYEWCERCGAVEYEDALGCRRRRCPLRKELQEERES